MKFERAVQRVATNKSKIHRVGRDQEQARKTSSALFVLLLTRGDLAPSYGKTCDEGGVRVCGDAVLRYFWCGFAVIFILTRGIAVSKH